MWQVLRGTIVSAVSAKRELGLDHPKTPFLHSAKLNREILLKIAMPRRCVSFLRYKRFDFTLTRTTWKPTADLETKIVVKRGYKRAFYVIRSTGSHGDKIQTSEPTEKLVEVTIEHLMIVLHVLPKIQRGADFIVEFECSGRIVNLDALQLVVTAVRRGRFRW